MHVHLKQVLKYCVFYIRCIPEGMTKAELVDLLSRLTVHMDEELKGYANVMWRSGSGEVVILILNSVHLEQI